MKLCLLFSALFIIGCNANKVGQSMMTAERGECTERIKPSGISLAWYNAKVDVMGRHLSGLLLIKEMPDKSTRLVFTNEAGLTFFDVAFDSLRRFQVKQVIPSLNKKVVLKTLEKDFSLMLGFPFDRDPSYENLQDTERRYGVKLKNEMAWLVTGNSCDSLHRIELTHKMKPKVTVFRESHGSPMEIRIKHHNFDMEISLIKLDRE